MSATALQQPVSDASSCTLGPVHLLAQSDKWVCICGLLHSTVTSLCRQISISDAKSRMT